MIWSAVLAQVKRRAASFATFGASGLRPGVAGLMSQSGGVGVALAGQLSRLGVGISSFVSVGSRLDVSGNDMLMWWEHDDVTRLAVLYLESFGNPRKFARTARRVGAKLPVLTVRSRHSAADQALFEQAGVIATDSAGELTDTPRCSPPSGSRPGAPSRSCPTRAFLPQGSGANRTRCATCRAASWNLPCLAPPAALLRGLMPEVLVRRLGIPLSTL